MSDTEDQSQKTEEPSQRKLEKARERGEVFTSKELNSFLSIFALSLCVVMLGGFFSVSLLGKLKKFITFPYEILATLNNDGGNSISDDVMGVMGNLIIDVSPFIIVPALIMMIVNT